MTESEFAEWAPRSRASYATDKMRANKLTQAEATAVAEADFNRLLSKGLATENNYLFTARDSDSNEALGYIWFLVRGAEDNKTAFICDVIIEEKHRRRGYGKQMLLLVEKEAVKYNANRVGLHVFGFNEAAIALYRSLGYHVTDLSMEKSLKD